MSRTTIVLASASPRRRELLGGLEVAFTVDPADLDEDAVAAGHAPDAAVEAVAAAKAAHVATRTSPDAVILAADTVVVLDGEVLGKPRDRDDATLMLMRLRDREHVVHTGVVVRYGDEAQHAVVSSDVRMRAYGQDEVAAYVTTGAPLDKAGAYGVQDAGFRPVESIRGCYCNVMGLPLWTMRRMLARAGILAPRRPDQAFARCAACPLAT